MKELPMENVQRFKLDLNCFQGFLYRNFKDNKCYVNMHPVSNQPVRIFATAKTHIFNTKEEINVDHRKLHPLIDETGTYTYNNS